MRKITFLNSKLSHLPALLPESNCKPAYDPFRSEPSGFIAVLFSLLAALLVAFVGLAIDTGRVHLERHRLQSAVDAAALAGVGSLVDAPTDDVAARNVASGIAAGNSLISAELSNAGGIESGNWNFGTSTFTANGSPLNAVRARAVRPVATTFANVMRITSVSPQVVAVAAVGGANQVTCIVPFGLNQSLLYGVNYGDVININNPSPGNWGKLDIGGNMSSRPNFIDAFTNGVCNQTVSVGDAVSPGTGYAGVSDGFQTRLETNPIVTMAVVDQFTNGNHDVNIVGFVVVEIIGQGNNGSNWNGQVRFIRSVTGSGMGGPGGAPYAVSRALVK